MAKLNAPCPAPEYSAEDIDGQIISLRSLRGKPVILSFFRDVACPFCNLRVLEYAKRYQQWSELGIEVVAVFSSREQDVRQFMAKRAYPFRAVADPRLTLYQSYGIKSSLLGVARGLLLRFTQARSGVRCGGVIDLKSPNARLLPADFLIGFDGRIVDLWYGADIGDHIPMDRIEGFAHKVNLANVKRRAKLRARKMKSKISAHKSSISVRSRAVIR